MNARSPSAALGLAVGLLMGTAGGQPVRAQSSLPESMRACIGLLEDAARLACYDRAVSALDSAAAAQAAERAQAAARLAQEQAARAQAQQAQEAQEAAARAARARVDAFGANSMGAEARPAEAADALDQLEAKVVEIFTTAQKQMVVVLDNGQIWRQTERELPIVVRPGDAVTIKAGLLGSYRLRFERQNRAIAVRRMR